MYQGMSSGMIIGIPCPACRCIGGHSPDCPEPTIKRLQSQQLHVGCPKCHERAVDRNDDDYMECRKCHTQFLRGCLEGHELILLDIRTDPDMAPFSVLPEKGTGQFSIDVALERQFRDSNRCAKGRDAKRSSSRLSPVHPRPSTSLGAGTFF